MDRNLLGDQFVDRFGVALCEEGVDGNIWIGIRVSDATVALCEEGVDRNVDEYLIDLNATVALCEEGVDRNSQRSRIVFLRVSRPLRRGRG